MQQRQSVSVVVMCVLVLLIVQSVKAPLSGAFDALLFSSALGKNKTALTLS